MSLRINTNVTALGALRNLDNTNSGMAGSISRLSSGLRIVTAADDPAGLVISEGMRAQMKGLTQAYSNSQNAINMSKTAEGAMEEVQSLLSDMRALAVQSANSATVDSAQLRANQDQIASSISSIDRIATTTQWGNKRLLDGTAGVRSSITDTADVDSAVFGSTFNGMTIASGPLTIQRTAAAAQESLTANQTFASAASVVTGGSFVINGYSFTANGTTDTVQDMVNAINGQSSNTGVSATVVASGSNVSLKLTANEYGANYKVDLVDTTGVFSTTPHPSPTVAGADAVATVTASVLDRNGNPTTTTATFTGGGGNKANGLTLADPDGNKISLTATGNAASALGTAKTIGAIATGDVQFQIGAMAGQSVSFSMPDIRAKNLGTNAVPGFSLADIDLTSTAGATRAMQIIDDAITSLSETRGKLGSFQKNVLESNARSLQVANENVTAAESTIRDADLATEMTTYTKYQILQQSGTAVLAQANQLPTQVLKLLQG